MRGAIFKLGRARGAVICRPRGQADLFHDPNGIPCGYHLRDLKYELFLKFLLAVLWRASVSTLQFFRGVQLGPHQARVLAILDGSRSLQQNNYSAILIHPLHQRYPGTILPPWRGRIDGVWFYRLYFPDVIAMIKMDARPTPRLLRPIELRSEGDNYLVFLPYKRNRGRGVF